MAGVLVLATDTVVFLTYTVNIKLLGYTNSNQSCDFIILY